MVSHSRRSFLKLSGAAFGAVALSSCSTAPAGDGGRSAGGGQVLKWWDQFAPQAELEEAIFQQFRQDSGVAVEYTTYNPNEMGQALQLAYSSQQMPDVFTLAGVDLPPARLVDEGWFAPLQLGDEVLSALPEGTLVDGFHVFDGQVYALPIRTFRQYETLTWYNTQLADKAGLDPQRDMATWDGFRSAARSIQESGGEGVFGFIAPLQFAPRMEAHLVQLALAGGAPGVIGGAGTGVFDPRTGAFTYDQDAFGDALEFLLSLQQDGLLFPASSSLDARSARARWSTGTAGIFFDGPWNVGVVQNEFTEFLDSMGVTSIPTSTAGMTVAIHQPPAGSAQSFWLSAQSSLPQEASDLIGRFAGEGISVRLAEAMDAMPLDLSAVARADVHPTYRAAADLFRQQVYLAPTPVGRNPAVADVITAMPPVEPDIGTIIQGVFSGQLPDGRAALRQYNDQLTAAREQALETVRGAGTDVSVEDWVFPDWQSGEDYAPGSGT